MPKRLPMLLFVFGAAALLLSGRSFPLNPSAKGLVGGPESPSTPSGALQAAATWFRRTSSPQPVRAAVSPMAGQALFQEKGCTVCHGDHLQGTDKGPSLKGVGRTLKREQIEHQIRFGGDNMPAFGEDSVSPEELSALVDFLAHQKKRK